MEIQKTLSTPKPPSKTAFLKTKSGKCHRPCGTLHRNPYLNFLREFRLRNSGLSAVEIIRRGAREWRSMPKEDKLQFIEEEATTTTTGTDTRAADTDARDAIPGQLWHSMPQSLCEKTSQKKGEMCPQTQT
uniref:HMG box domain-containing protein n=1 Tax=Bactrocera latifrons TaxID=174628 RepID=A0A0K8U403_BACLA